MHKQEISSVGSPHRTRTPLVFGCEFLWLAGRLVSGRERKNVNTGRRGAAKARERQRAAIGGKSRTVIASGLLGRSGERPPLTSRNRYQKKPGMRMRVRAI